MLVWSNAWVRDCSAHVPLSWGFFICCAYIKNTSSVKIFLSRSVLFKKSTEMFVLHEVQQNVS